MTRHSTSLTARIATLERARAKAAQLKRGETLTSEPMAKLLSVRWPTLRDWCDDIPGLESTGCFERGSNGIEYVFRPAKTVAYLLRHFRAEQKKSVADRRRLQKIVTGTEPSREAEPLSLDDMRKALAVTTGLQEARRRAGELVEWQKVLGILQPMFSDMLQSGLKAVQELDPNGRWDPGQRSISELTAQAILERQEKIIQEGLSELSGGAA